jgi:CheY-like chemotaxis protein
MNAAATVPSFRPALVPAAATGAQPRDGRRVLLVEDNLMNQVFGEAMLESLGFGVTIASDGAEALRHWHAEGFDLILMDCRMPVMDGLSAAREIRRCEDELGITNGTPILALTGCTDTDDREACTAAGMDGMLSKPFDPAELVAFIEGGGLNPLSVAEADWIAAAPMPA